VYFVARHKRHERGGKTSPTSALLGLAVLAATAVALAPSTASSPTAADPSVAHFEAIQRIVALRCAPCHSGAPTQPGFATAPKGLLLDSPEAILTHVSVIAPQVATNAMPIGNLTGMTEAERTQLLDWIRNDSPR
jgi:uncharacterized membrane protein